MKEYDLFAFGNISIDIIRTPTSEVNMTGGAILYAAWVGHQLGYNIGILTKISKNDIDRVKEFPLPKEDVYIVPSKETTSILNIYNTEDKEKRICKSKGRAEPYQKSDFPDFKAKIIQYSGLIQGEIDLELIKYLSDKGKLAIDAQGLLRKAFKNGDMEFDEFKDIKEAMNYIYYFKADAAEAQFITGINTETQEGRTEAAKMLLSWGAQEVIISHNKALTCVVNSTEIIAPFKNKGLEGRTGRGDTSFSTYLLKRLSNNPRDSIMYSAALTSMKMEIPGPFKQSKEEVEVYLNENYN